MILNRLFFYVTVLKRLKKSRGFGLRTPVTFQIVVDMQIERAIPNIYNVWLYCYRRGNYSEQFEPVWLNIENNTQPFFGLRNKIFFIYQALNVLCIANITNIVNSLSIRISLSCFADELEFFNHGTTYA